MKKLIALLSNKVFEYVYKKQNEARKKRMAKLKKELSKGGICAGKKLHTGSAATLTIENNASKEKKANQQKIEQIINSFLDDPKKFFDYIKGAKTPVYKVKNAGKILAQIGEFEGFIYPQKGFKAFYLNLILNKTIGFKTPEMFVISGYNVNPYAIAYQFYNWYCYKMKLDGYDSISQENFKQVFQICESTKINLLSYSQILGLKNAVRRDIEAIEFVQKLAKNKSMAKKNLEKIKQGAKVNI